MVQLPDGAAQVLMEMTMQSTPLPGPLDWYMTLYTGKQTIGVVATALHGSQAWDYGKHDDGELEDIKNVKLKPL